MPEPMPGQAQATMKPRPPACMHRPPLAPPGALISPLINALISPPFMHAQAATGAPQCSVYAMAPGSIVLGITLMATQVRGIPPP